MSNTQKIRYAVFGSVITFVVLVIVAMGVSPLIARNNGVFDEIQCRQLTVVDKAGKKAIVLNAMEEANHILLYDQKGHLGLHLWASEGYHSISVLDDSNQTGVSLVSRENGNAISIHSNGKVALDLFVREPPIGTGIVIRDQAGNIKWTTLAPIVPFPTAEGEQ
jgi:hypothetical protein